MPLPPKQIPNAIEAAKKAFKEKFTPGFYHSSANPDIEAFNPNAKPNEWIASTQTKPRGAVFVGRDPRFTESLIGKEVNPQNKIVDFKTGATTYPVSVNLGKHFDYLTPEGLEIIKEYKKLNPNAKLSEFLERGSWEAIEQPEFLNFLKNKKFDSFATQEVGLRNIGVFNPKNIRGKFAEYNPEHAESADFMKAEGGAINPIKTPREMLFELANVPHMADGRRVIQAGDEMKRLIQEAIQKYIRLYKKPPPPEDVKALEAHAAAISQKPTIWTDPATQARARHELATNPGLMNPEDLRDPFITQAMVGRGVKGTRQAPFVADINDPNLQRSLEMKQMSGKLEDLAGAEGIPSTTPAADALAKMATGIEQSALGAGKIPLIDKLKMEFFKRNKRYPNDEELQTIIAEFNPLRHQYGAAGPSIVQSRPPTAKGMSDWRAKARTEGVPEVYLEKPPADYPNYLQAELDIAKGVQPAVRPTSDDLIKNLNREYAAGRSVSPLSPADMAAEMAVSGKTPSKFEDPYERAVKEAKQKNIPVAGESHLDRLIRYSSMPGAAMAAHTAGQRLAQGDLGEAALHGTSALGLGLASTKKYLKPGLGIAGAAAVPMSIEEAISRYDRGDRTGAVLSTIMALSNASQAHPATAVPGAALGIGTAVVDAMRNKPEYRSVMEDYK